MKRSGLILVILVFLLSVTLLASPASAQNVQELAKVQVDLWPEYDSPAMLVITDLTLPAGSRLPAVLTLRIPATSSGVNAVASKQPDGTLVNIQYDQPVVKGDWIEVTFAATTLESRVEFYDQELVKDGASRSYLYRWPGDYAVKDFFMVVQQPLSATNMVITPSLGSGTIHEDELTYYSAQIGSLGNGQTFDLEVNYQNPSGSLSTDSLPIEPSAPISKNPSILGNLSSYVQGILSSLGFWLLLILSILLIAGGAFWYWRSGNKTSKPEPHRRRKSTASEKPDPTQSASDGVHCHQCGKRASPGDRFCRVCGTQLRIS